MLSSDVGNTSSQPRHDGATCRAGRPFTVLLAIALLLLAGCGSGQAEPAPTTPPTTDSSDGLVDRDDLLSDPLYQLLLSLLPGPCPATTTTTTPATAEIVVEDLFEALGLETLPAPACTPTTEALP